MQLKTFAISALAVAIIVVCVALQPDEDKSALVLAKAAAKSAAPKLISGASGAMLAGSCEGCHGSDGNSQGPATPTIAGMSINYLVEVMEEFRDDETKSTIMGRIARGYTDDEIKAMAAYYADIPFNGAGQRGDAATIATGKKLQKRYCGKCHHDGGADADDDSGILAGQWPLYLHYTLQDFANGDRAISQKMEKKIGQVLAAEGQAGIDAIITCLGSQR